MGREKRVTPEFGEYKKKKKILPPNSGRYRDSRRRRKQIWGKREIERLWWTIGGKDWFTGFVTSSRNRPRHQFIEDSREEGEFGWGSVRGEKGEESLEFANVAFTGLCSTAVTVESS
jgi:hypothetical protein